MHGQHNIKKSVLLCYIFWILDCILCAIHINEVYEAFFAASRWAKNFAHSYTQFALQGALHEEHTEKVYYLIRLPWRWEYRC